jgi:UDP-N-acetylglucosamine acyltransferase
MPIYIADTACVDPRAQIDEGVYIGPFCVIGPHAQVGADTRLENQVTLMGHVRLGRRNHVYPGAVLGGEPQDVSYTGSDTKVIIGDDNIIRECVTVNRASEKEDGLTRIGNCNFLMACCHVAHDCKLGNHIIIANNTLLGGHVHVDDYASLSGGVAVHHFATIGGYSFVGGMSAVRHDVPPYMLVEGHPAKPRCINVVGLKRNNFPPDGRGAPPALSRQGRSGQRLGDPPQRRPVGPASHPPAGLRPEPA